MDRDWLDSELAAGRSIEAIAREAGRHPSTVAYWVNKHGLASTHAERHRAKGRLERGELEALVERGLSVGQIARELHRSPTAVRHWLRRHGLVTRPARYAPAQVARPDAVLRECSTHGFTWFRLGADRVYRCPACNSARVAARRRAVKATLVEEAGGRCVSCGFDRYAGALQFHHVDPSAKSFEIGGRGLTRSLAALREEARKCVLLCANCHAAVEAGLLPVDPSADTQA